MNFLIIYLASSLLALFAHGQMVTIPSSINKIKTNLETSKINKLQHDNALIYILANIDEISKASQKTDIQKLSVKADLENNREFLKKIAKKEKEILSLISNEKNKLAFENKQVEQLEILLKQIKVNQNLRQNIIDQYQEQLQRLHFGSQSWSEREKIAAQQYTNLDSSLNTLLDKKNHWIKIKKQIQIASDEWGLEVKTQQQTFDLYTQLADN